MLNVEIKTYYASKTYNPILAIYLQTVRPMDESTGGCSVERTVYLLTIPESPAEGWPVPSCVSSCFL